MIIFIMKQKEEYISKINMPMEKYGILNKVIYLRRFLKRLNNIVL